MIYLAYFGGGFLAGTWAGILILALMEAAKRDDDKREGMEAARRDDDERSD